MKIWEKRRTLCGLAALLLISLGKADRLPEAGVYWKGVRQVPPTPEVLSKVLKDHELWIESNGRDGTRADLSHGNLSNLDLQGVNLWSADLEGAYLAGANMTNAVLGFDGQKAEQVSKAPGKYLLAPARIGQITVTDANGRIIAESPPVPDRTNLRGASLWNAILHKADLDSADLSKTTLSGADLSNADLRGADLTEANLAGAILDGSNVSNANLDRALFEPISLSAIVGSETAKNLYSIRFQSNPDALIKLRKQFQDEGLIVQEREITYAINRRRTELDPRIERWFRIVAFDLTCHYGMNPGRPLRIIAAIWAIFSLLYFTLLHVIRPFRVRINRFYQTEDKTREFSMWSPPLRTTTKMKMMRTWLRFERRAVCAMMFFSLVNAFNLGYREFSIGQWLRMLTKRDYEVKATGWVRSLAGVQSLASIYLFAIWILTYFGRPFD
jgi:uncharacterized protein YjbI with pentapeptide repeats